MQSALETLRVNLDKQGPAASDLVLQDMRLADALKGAQQLCDRFRSKCETYTKHSKDTALSKRDRIIVNLHESDFNKFNSRLQDHRQVILLVTTSVNL